MFTIKSTKNLSDEEALSIMSRVPNIDGIIRAVSDKNGLEITFSSKLKREEFLLLETDHRNFYKEG